MSATLVEFPGARRRTCNYTRSERCGACDDTALIVAEIEVRPVLRRGKEGVYKVGESEIEVIGPCPHCERGYRVEFGIGTKKDGAEYTNPDGGPWGREGFWRGRSVPDVGAPS